MKKIFLFSALMIVFNMIYSQDVMLKDTTISKKKPKVEIRWGTTIYFEGPSQIRFIIDDDYRNLIIETPSGDEIKVDLYDWQLNPSIIPGIEFAIHADTKLGFMIFCSGTFLLPTWTDAYETVEKSGYDYSYHYSSRLYAGQIYAGISKKVGWKHFGITTEAGLGVAGFGKLNDFYTWIREGNQYTYPYDERRQDGFTNFSGKFSAGFYFTFGGFSIYPSYTVSFASRKEVGQVIIQGINISFGFKY